MSMTTPGFPMLPRILQIEDGPRFWLSTGSTSKWVATKMESPEDIAMTLDKVEGSGFKDPVSKAAKRAKVSPLVNLKSENQQNPLA